MVNTDEKRLAALEREVAELRSELRAARAPAPNTEEPLGRRALLRGAAAGALGAAVALRATPAAAADGATLILGTPNQGFQTQTSLQYSSVAVDDSAFLVHDATVFGTSVRPALITGASFGPYTTGVSGQTALASGFGVAGRNSAAGGIGTLGEATATSGNTVGVKGTAAGPAGVGVVGESVIGVAGRSTLSSFGTGVSGEGNGAGGVGVLGASSGSAGVGVNGVGNGSGGIGVTGTGVATGVTGSGANSGVTGTSTAASSVGVVGTTGAASGTGVRGTGSGSSGIGVHADGTAIGVLASASVSSGVGVNATCAAPAGRGVFAGANGSNGIGIEAVGQGGQSLGGTFAGGGANLRLVPAGSAAPARVDTHAAGEVLVDAAGDAWCCVAAGTPGTWRKLAGPGTAGTLHVLPAPIRAYDSRPSADDDPPLGVGGLVRDVSLAVAVPTGTVAAILNVTITETALSGFLSVASAAVPAGSIGHSNLNWSASGQTIPNMVLSAVHTNRAIRLKIGGAVGCSTHVIVDVFAFHL